MEINELQRRAGITEEATDIKELWSQYTRMSEQIAKALSRTGIDTQGGGAAPEGQLNPLQVNDIEYHMKMVAEQLERLDKVYGWRKHMDERRARTSVSKVG
jgi:hypothetical protein